MKVIRPMKSRRVVCEGRLSERRMPKRGRIFLRIACMLRNILLFNACIGQAFGEGYEYRPCMSNCLTAIDSGTWCAKALIERSAALNEKSIPFPAADAQCKYLAAMKSEMRHIIPYYVNQLLAVSNNYDQWLASHSDFPKWSVSNCLAQSGLREYWIDFDSCELSWVSGHEGWPGLMGLFSNLTWTAYQPSDTKYYHAVTDICDRVNFGDYERKYYVGTNKIPICCETGISGTYQFAHSGDDLVIQAYRPVEDRPAADVLKETWDAFCEMKYLLIQEVGLDDRQHIDTKVTYNRHQQRGREVYEIGQNRMYSVAIFSNHQAAAVVEVYQRRIADNDIVTQRIDTIITADRSTNGFIGFGYEKICTQSVPMVPVASIEIDAPSITTAYLYVQFPNHSQYKHTETVTLANKTTKAWPCRADQFNPWILTRLSENENREWSVQSYEPVDQWMEYLETDRRSEVSRRRYGKVQYYIANKYLAKWIFQYQ